MTVTLGPLLREHARRHTCRVWIDGKAAGEMVREGSPGRATRWYPKGPAAGIWPEHLAGCRKPEVLRRLRSMLQMLGSARRAELVRAIAAYDRGDTR